MHILQNPHEENPPDYNADRYAPVRQQLVDPFNINHVDAAQRLLNIWYIQNALDRQEWDSQRDHENEILAREQARKEEEEEGRKEERQKYPMKFLPYANVPLSSSMIPIIPSFLALRKLRKVEYVPLYFFTNKGLADAQMISSMDEDTDDEGVPLHPLVSIAFPKAKQPVVEDRDLSWAQLDEATHRILQAMKEANWPRERVDSMFDFWTKLSAHECRHDPDETAQQALIVYQATYRKRWHDTLGTSSSFNPKYIDKEALVRIKQKIVDQKYQDTEKRLEEASHSTLLLS